MKVLRSGEDSRDYVLYLLVHENPCVNRTYLGITNNPKNRLRAHNGEKSGGAKATRSYLKQGKWKYCLQIKNLTKGEALSYERSVKNTRNGKGKTPAERRIEVLQRQKFLEKFPEAEFVYF